MLGVVLSIALVVDAVTASGGMVRAKLASSGCPRVRNYLKIIQSFVTQRGNEEKPNFTIASED
jgi:hypothetical protein